MIQQRQLTPNDHDFYIMELDSGLYVDGKFKGSVSRFINHSCEPNCELQRWNVRGMARIGIFALRDIPAGEPLSYDYQFDTQEQNIFQCHCGKPRCRGTMAPKKLNSTLDVDALTRAERTKLIAAARQKERRLEESRAAEELSRSLTSKYLPGDPRSEIRSGPTRIDFPEARLRHLFLPRNALRGSSSFLKRAERLKARDPMTLQRLQRAEATWRQFDSDIKAAAAASSKGRGKR
jgi:hypothetical protein